LKKLALTKAQQTDVPRVAESGKKESRNIYNQVTNEESQAASHDEESENPRGRALKTKYEHIVIKSSDDESSRRRSSASASRSRNRDVSKSKSNKSFSSLANDQLACLMKSPEFTHTKEKQL
jgi:hypothetical protein